MTKQAIAYAMDQIKPKLIVTEIRYVSASLISQYKVAKMKQ